MALTNHPDFIEPDWPAPATVKAVVTTRNTGESLPPFDSFNLAGHVEDSPEHVQANRQLLRQTLQLPAEPVSLQQVHGIRVVRAELAAEVEIADASTTKELNTVCTVMTADCLPVLICNQAGDQVAAVHAGWRGLVGGILETSVNTFQQPGEELIAWLGPAIGPEAFEVGDEVRQMYVEADADLAEAFVTGKPGKWYLDIYQAARTRLEKLGVSEIHGGGLCTHTDAARFYSYRRDGVTGRMASMIWITA